LYFFQTVEWVPAFFCERPSGFLLDWFSNFPFYPALIIVPFHFLYFAGSARAPPLFLSQSVPFRFKYLTIFHPRVFVESSFFFFFSPLIMDQIAAVSPFFFAFTDFERPSRRFRFSAIYVLGLTFCD